MKCVFCDLNRKKEKIIFETDNFILLESKLPIVPGHCLLVPKIHISIEVELDIRLAKEYKRASDQAYKYVEKTYEFAPISIVNPPQDQSIKHLHKHFLPGVFGVLGVEKALRVYLKNVKQQF